MAFRKKPNMKKVYSFLTSMRFGLIVLGCMIAVSLCGSLIPQNNDAMYYVQNYPDQYALILKLGLNRVFSSWYFLLLVVLLCVNLTCCTLRRLKHDTNEKPVPESFTPVMKFGEGDEEAVRELLRNLRCKETVNGPVTRYTGREAGRYGSLLLHAGILLTTVFWAVGSIVPKILDETCMPGESIRLEDNTVIKVNDFSIEDENGSLDYASMIEIILPDGSSSGEKRVSVNHPVSMGDYKVYQQTYGTKGRVTVTDGKGNEDSFYLDPQDFLSADGVNGIVFDDLYPGFEQDETGALTLITNTSGSYPNPVYVYVQIENGMGEQMLAFPKDSVTIGDYTFTFQDPVEYPGLRIKHAPSVINLFLLLSVILMTAGLYLIFFVRPVNVLVSSEGCTIADRNEGLSLQLKHCLRDRGDK